MSQAQALRIAIDIGSTVVKLAEIGIDDKILSQKFYPRDFEKGIARQIEELLDQLALKVHADNILICSSANGGLRVGIVCLSESFSGEVLRNQALSAGANPIFVHTFDSDSVALEPVDILLVGGGIDCEDAAPLARRLKIFDPAHYRYGALLYAANNALANQFLAWHEDAIIIPNPLSVNLEQHSYSVFEALRNAYLQDLVKKEGISQLRDELAVGIRPTPEVVSSGFRRIQFQQSTLTFAGGCILFDIGGATTDIHYSTEIVREDSEHKPDSLSSVARYVFTDLGIVASRETTLLKLRNHTRLLEFLNIALLNDTREIYQLLREGEYEPDNRLYSYACLFLALSRFSSGRGPGLPTADFSKVMQIALTGGAAQNLDPEVVKKLFCLFLTGVSANIGVLVDRDYKIWVNGITYNPGTYLSLG